MSNLEKTIARAFLEMADGLETGSFGPRPKIALTGMGSEHGEANAMAAAQMAAKKGVDVYYIGTLEAEGVTTVHVDNEDEGHKKMEQMVESHEVDGAVTMHFPFPIGVSTVGRVITPARGKEMFIATSTGTSSADRIEGMIKNAVYGIITAKACGVKNPTVGILNVDGARQTEMALKELQAGGYDFAWATSARADGGAVLRGNDVLQGTPDVLVCDSLTGNVLVKMLSAFSTGGSFEATGYGYGPGIGPGYDKPRKAAAKPAAEEEEVKAPPAEPCTASIPGIEVMDLEDAAKALWKAGIYAETGMGCTGPLVMMSEANHAKALEILKKAGYVG